MESPLFIKRATRVRKTARAEWGFLKEMTDFKVIKGTWQFNIYYNNEVIYTRKFELK